MKTFNEFNKILEEADSGLAAKASKSGISIGTLRKVYRRGVAAWNSGHRPGTTPQQWGMARVNSYITKGKGTYHGADKDLREEDLHESGGPVVWKSGCCHVEKYGDNSFALYVNDKKHKFYTSLKDAKAASINFREEELSEDRSSYHSGLSASTAAKREAHWKAASKLSDRDPKAYKPAPGDATAKTKESKHTKKYRDMFGEGIDEELWEACWSGYKQVGIKKKGDRMVPNCVKEELDTEEQFDLIESVIEELSAEHGIDSELIWEDLEEFSDEQLLEYAIDAAGHKSSTGGMTQKGVDAVNRKTGGNLQTAVTTPPSKLKPGSKAAKRRKSFCARMGGVDGPMKDEKGRPTRKALALRKWNC